VLFQTRSRLAYLGYILRGMVGARWQVTGIELKDAERATVSAGSSTQRVFVEADGELLGTLPAEISIVPDVLNLLVPRTPQAEDFCANLAPPQISSKNSHRRDNQDG